MVSLALLKDRVLARTKTARRSFRRGDVLAWSIAAAALFGTAASMALGTGSGALALVVPGGPIVVEPSRHVEEAAPAAALLDPTKFRRPAPADDGRPRVAVILRGLGLSRSLTMSAIQLPPDLTLGLSAYAREAQKTADAARAAGHEIFLDIPLEPAGFPANDPGPQALLSSLAAAENAERLDWSLARFAGYPGVVLAEGSPVLSNSETLKPILKSPALQGLVWAYGKADGLTDTPVISASVKLTIAADQDPRALDEALTHLEALARQEGSALAVVEPSPVMIDRLATWARSLEQKGIVLVPASALAQDPPAPLAAVTDDAAPTSSDASHDPAHSPRAALAEATGSEPASETPPSALSGGHDSHH